MLYDSFYIKFWKLQANLYNRKRPSEESIEGGKGGCNETFGVDVYVHYPDCHSCISVCLYEDLANCMCSLLYVNISKKALLKNIKGLYWSSINHFTSSLFSFFYERGLHIWDTTVKTPLVLHFQVFFHIYNKVTCDKLHKGGICKMVETKLREVFLSWHDNRMLQCHCEITFECVYYNMEMFCLVRWMFKLIEQWVVPKKCVKTFERVKGL